MKSRNRDSSIVPLILFLLGCFGVFQQVAIWETKGNFADKIASRIGPPSIIFTKVHVGRSFHNEYSIRSKVDDLNCYVHFDTFLVECEAQKVLNNYKLPNKSYYVWKSKRNPDQCYYQEF